MTAEPGELPRDPGGRQHEVHAARGDGAVRHPVVRGRVRILGEGDTAFGLDRLQSQGPVRSGPGQDDADGLRPLRLRQGVQEGVDRHVLAPGVGPGHELQQAVPHGDVLFAGSHVYVVGCNHRFLPDLGDRHPAPLREELGHHAFMARVEVLHEHIGHARIVGKCGQELLEGLQPARGGTHSDDGKRALSRAGRGRLRLVAFGRGVNVVERRHRPGDEKRWSLLRARRSRWTQ